MTDKAPPRVRRKFRPTLWASIFTAAAAALLVALGSWQVQRKGEKEALIAMFEARARGPAVALPEFLEPPEAFLFARVRLEGRFLHEREQYLSSKVHKGEVGLHVITPLLLRDGRAVLVDRGWSPLVSDVSAAFWSRPAGIQVIEGILRQGGYGGPEFLRPENDPGAGLYNWPDLMAMASSAQLERPITTHYVMLDAMPPDGGYPVPRGLAVDLPNNHLQYAITWFALSAVLLVIYLIYHWRPEPETHK